MKLFISLIISQVLIANAFCSDTVLIKASVKYNLNGSFFDCKRNDFLSILDTSSRKELLQDNFSDISITINSQVINFNSSYKNISYKTIKHSSTVFFFESNKRSLARAISECNRERFSYYLKLDLEKNIIQLYYDMSEFKKSDLLVFEGKVLQYCVQNNIFK